MLQKPDVQTAEILKLADFIEHLEPGRFSMAQWGMYEEPRCICGWYQQLHGHVDKMDQDNVAANLGLDRDIAHRLFTNGALDQKSAAKTLRHLAVTGELVFA